MRGLRIGHTPGPQLGVHGSDFDIENSGTSPQTVTLSVSYDGAQSWRVANSALILPGETTAKDPVLPDAVIGMGWGNSAPTHAKVSSVSPAQFRSDVTIEAD